ncbi:MAG: sugar phosphate isomerase/epimerase [Planctomycetes bacterium]|nr:sugar phosphate isomerase/epimerase [Planctomycetota bacterium]
MVFGGSSFQRRRFLHLTIGAMVGGFLVPPHLQQLLAAAKNAELKLGLVTYQWGKDWDLDTVLQNCADAGFRGVELRSTHKHGVEINLNAQQRSDVRKKFVDSPISLVGLGTACEYHAADTKLVKRNIDETKAWIDLCRDLGGGGVKVRPNGLPKEAPVEKTLEQIGNSLNGVGQYAAEQGVQIRVEVHGTGTQEIPHMKTIMDVANHPSVAVCWNCNPTDLKGDGFSANYKTLEDRLGTIHIHDLRPGKVDYPWEELFARLRNCEADSFTGWCLLEDGTVPPDIVEAMKENRVVFEKLKG